MHRVADPLAYFARGRCCSARSSSFFCISTSYCPRLTGGGVQEPSRIDGGVFLGS